LGITGELPAAADEFLGITGELPAAVVAFPVITGELPVELSAFLGISDMPAVAHIPAIKIRSIIHPIFAFFIYIIY
jgi:hypothetical protein